jgi:hypothetical protein
MKDAPVTDQAEGASDRANCDANVNPPRFQTDNPRHLRALAALLRRPMPREHLDRETGASNGPDLVADLRAKGLDVPCSRAPVIDRDGHEVLRGIYHLTSADRRRIYAFLKRRRA